MTSYMVNKYRILAVVSVSHGRYFRNNIINKLASNINSLSTDNTKVEVEIIEREPIELTLRDLEISDIIIFNDEDYTEIVECFFSYFNQRKKFNKNEYYKYIREMDAQIYIKKEVLPQL